MICLMARRITEKRGTDVATMRYGRLDIDTGKGGVEASILGRVAYAVDLKTLPPTWRPLFTNLNDGSNEGLTHRTLPYTSVQFHPEFRGGPEDTAFLFDSFLKSVHAVKAAQASIHAVAAEPVFRPARLAVAI